MRIPYWNPESRPQPEDLVKAIEARRGGTLLNLDRALLWSEPLARGWNTYIGAVRTQLSASRRLRELAICTVALITGAHYEYRHHAPDYLAAGGSQASLCALDAYVQSGGQGVPHGLTGDEALVAQLKDRFDTTQLVEITAAIAAYNMVARFLVALGVTPEN